MDDGVELFDAALCECKSRELGAVKLAVGKNDARAEVLNDGVVDRFARLHQVARDLVGLQDVGAMLREEHGCGGLAAAEAAGKSDAQHRVTGSP